MRAITLSFDDGHPADIKVAEYLARHGLTATFYVPVRNSEGRPVVDAAQLRSLASAGFEIGGHTLDHLRLTALDESEARRQVADGKAALEDMLGSEVRGFAYPGGRGGSRERAMVKAAGFSFARTTQMFRLDRNTSSYRLPTTVQFYPHRLPALLRNWLRQGGGARRLGLALACSRQCSVQEAVGYPLSRLTEGQVLHIWGHGWEIDQLGLWPEFDKTLGMLAGAQASCVANGSLVLADAAGTPV
ncbi:polysaccharide deacetylase family protein [Radicibacter daui]|uniref:polysaccharide deacetylase family protein n=1 Tax=Radicibacter daui TaxID=3064829 RepID=UPI004046D931